MSDILIKNVFLSEDIQDTVYDILILDGKIDKISSEIATDKHLQIIDARNCIAISGMIDVHTHLREPGLSHKENFRTGSMAAARGGVSTVFDMPNTIPICRTKETLVQKKLLAQKSIVDYALHLGVNMDSRAHDIQRCVQSFGTSLPSTKIFLNKSTGALKIDDMDLLEELVSQSWFVCAHAEEEKIEEIVPLTQKYAIPLYLCHISRKSEIECIISLRKQATRAPIYVELCPHHLAFTRNDLKKNPLLTMMPPLQEEADRCALWDALHANHVDSIGSDHAPHLLSEKNHALKHHKEIYGVPGLESSLPFLLDKVTKKELSLHRVQELTSQNPAKIFGLKSKGTLEEGKDADITLVDLSKKTTPSSQSTVSACSWNIFEGISLSARIEATLSRGNIVYLSHVLQSKIQNRAEYTVLLSNTEGSIFLNKGVELHCHLT